MSLQAPLGLDIPCGWHRCDLTAGHEHITYGWHHREQWVFRLDDKGRRERGHPEWMFYCIEQGCQTYVFEPGEAVCPECKVKVIERMHADLRKVWRDSRKVRPRRLR